MKDPQKIIIDVTESNPPRIDITFYYKKTFRQISFLADSTEDLVDRIGKRYKFITREQLTDK